MLSPVILFVYARPEHTKRTLLSLKDNSYAQESELYIFSDGPKNKCVVDQVNEVRDLLSDVEKRNWFKSVHISYSSENKGLANSVISGVRRVISKHHKVIVIEDDLVVAPDFLAYMNEALDFFKGNKSIWSISGYTYDINFPIHYSKDVFLSLRGCSWGWATWQDRWNLVDWDVSDYKAFEYNLIRRRDFNRGGRDLSAMLDAQMDGRIDSWAIRWCFSQYKHHMYTIYPSKTKVRNIGLDGSGTHRVKDKDVQKLEVYNVVFENVTIDNNLLISFRKNFDKYNKSGFINFARHLIQKFRIITQ